MLNQSEFSRQLKQMEERLCEIRTRRFGTPLMPEEMLDKTLAELGNSFEELKTAQEEITSQSDELALANKEIMAQRNRYEDLFAFAPDGYLVTDTNLVIREANRAAYGMLGMESGEMLGQSLWSWVEQRDQPALSELLKRSREENVTLEQDLSLKTPFLRLPVSCSLRVAPINKKVLHEKEIRILMRDITERKRVEQRLITDEKRLRDLAAELSRTEQRERRRIANELHDYLTQMLIVCRMRIEQLRNTNLEDTQSQKVAEIDRILENSIQYTRTLISELCPTVLYTSGLLAAVRWLADQMQSSGLHVTVQQIGHEIKSSDDTAALLFQAVRELLINVVKHAKTTEAVVKIQGKRNFLVITVEDNGAGFAPSSEPDPLLPDHFGLFSLKERLKAVNGFLEVDSTLGKGTSVRVILPLQPEPVEPVLPHRPVMQSGTASSSRRNGEAVRILIVDDHDMVRKGIRSILESQSGLEIAGEGCNGEEALSLVEELRPELILMDMKMSKLNGIEATRRIKESFPSVSIIGLSAYEDEAVSELFKSAGADAFLLKGCPQEELLQTILSMAGVPSD